MRPLLALVLLATACGSMEDEGFVQSASEDGELDVGDVQNDLLGDEWGAARTCKALPTGLPVLRDPVIVISLDGLTLHLWDRQGTFDKVYPIGPGAVKDGKSLTPVGQFKTGPADAVGGADDGTVLGKTVWRWWYRCRIWWTDTATGQILPVFAGLPFIRLDTPGLSGYAIHGPVDNFPAANGGSLRRGYVSHGCVRMSADGIIELFALLRGRANVPVTIQRAVERDDLARAVDLAPKWIGSECASASECGYAGATCEKNAYGRSFCSMSCTGSCPDRPGEGVTACAPNGRGGGMCVRQATALNNDCRGYDAFRPTFGVKRYNRATYMDACLPGSHGFVGDPCYLNADCAAGRFCERPPSANGPGLCTQPCGACPTQNGIASTCVSGRCLEKCDVQDACGGALATECQEVRRTAAGTVIAACVP